MRRLMLLAMSLSLLLSASVQAKRISHTENDFIIARKVDVRAKGTYKLLDSVAEKPGVYDFPCYTAWDYTATYDYEPGYNPFKIHKNKITAEDRVRDMAKRGLEDKIKSSRYDIPVKKWKNKKWIDYKTITVYGKDTVVIE